MVGLENIQNLMDLIRQLNLNQKINNLAKRSYYEPNSIDYFSDSGRRYVLNALRILGFYREDSPSYRESKLENP